VKKLSRSKKLNEKKTSAKRCGLILMNTGYEKISDLRFEISKLKRRSLLTSAATMMGGNQSFSLEI
jgi:hypothetical protein